MKYIILGHENPDVDSIVSGHILETVMKKKGYDVCFCIPDSVIASDTEKVCTKYRLFPNRYKVEELDSTAKYILVDHHDREVPGEIVAIFDHHPTNKDFSNIKYYKNEKVSSTACLIAKECIKDISKKEIELACLATFVDTVSFHSSKTVKADMGWINEMATKYDFDYDEMYRDGLCLTEIINLEEVAYNGLKKANYDGFIIHSSYIQIVDFDKHELIITKILNKLKKYVKKNKIDLFVFIVYDMTNFYTKVFKINNEIETDEYFLYASRGNTIIPDIVKKYCDK